MAEKMWNETSRWMPPIGTVVEVLHGDKKTISKLKYDGRMWWTPDGAMYVYWNPTLWRHV